MFLENHALHIYEKSQVRRGGKGSCIFISKNLRTYRVGNRNCHPYCSREGKFRFPTLYIFQESGSPYFFDGNSLPNTTLYLTDGTVPWLLFEFMQYGDLAAILLANSGVFSFQNKCNCQLSCRFKISCIAPEILK